MSTQKDPAGLLPDHPVKVGLEDDHASEVAAQAGRILRVPRRSPLVGAELDL